MYLVTRQKELTWRPSDNQGSTEAVEAPRVMQKVARSPSVSMGSAHQALSLWEGPIISILPSISMERVQLSPFVDLLNDSLLDLIIVLIAYTHLVYGCWRTEGN